MSKPEERSRTEVPSEERVEGGVEEKNPRRAAPIDEDVAGPLNAALPDDNDSIERKEAKHG